MIARALVASLGAAAALALPAVASADTADVGIQTSAFGPSQISVLAGDSVMWMNQSLRSHTVTARDGSFGSQQLGTSGMLTQKFPAAGTFAYYCQIHPFMTGEVDVYPVLLKGPIGAVSRGGQMVLDGRAEAGTSSVDIQADSGTGYANVATAAVDGTGHFHVALPATASAKYRAVTAAGASPEVQVLVIDRKLTVRAARHGRYSFVRVSANPRDPGAIVVLEVQSRERFGWWPAQRHRLDGTSRTVFKVRAGKRIRVELTLPDGWTPVITSPAMRLR
jgi:plastocyanin